MLGVSQEVSLARAGAIAQYVNQVSKEAIEVTFTISKHVCSQNYMHSSVKTIL